MKNKLSIKTLFLNTLNESTEPLFHLAPDVVGSINNVYSAKNKRIVVVDFNTVDDRNMKLIVPRKCYSDFSNTNPGGDNMAKSFLQAFLQGAKPHQQEDETLDEIVDEYGEIYDEKDDLPAAIRGNPGYGQTKHSGSAKRQMASQFSRMNGPLGYGGIVW